MTSFLFVSLLLCVWLTSCTGCYTAKTNCKQDMSHATTTLTLSGRLGPGSTTVSPVAGLQWNVLSDSTPAAPHTSSTTARAPFPQIVKTFLPRGTPIPDKAITTPRTNSASPTPRDCSCDVTEDHDVKPVLASSSPGALLDDEEVYDIINAGGVSSRDKAMRKKLRQHKLRIASKGLVSRAAYRTYAKLLHYLTLPLVVVGVVSNVIAARVFWRMARSVTNTYMKCLVCLDIGYLLVVMCSAVVMVGVKARWVQLGTELFFYLYVAYKFLILSLRQVVISVTAFMSLDRYLVITSPFKQRSIPICRRPMLMVALVVTLVLALNSYKTMVLQVKTGLVPDANSTVLYVMHTQLYLQHRDVLDVVAIVGSCLFQYLPLLAMLVANACLIVSLCRYSRQVSVPAWECRTPETAGNSTAHADTFSGTGSQASLSCSVHSATSTTSLRTSSPRETAAAKKQFFQLERRKCVTVITYSLLFLFLALPFALLPMLQKAFPEFTTYRTQHYLYLMYARIHPILDVVSASINFFVFFLKGGAFRAGVRRLVQCQRRGPRTGTFKLRGKAGGSEEGDGQAAGPQSVQFRGSVKLGDS